MLGDDEDRAQKRHETRTRLRNYIWALDELLGLTGPENQPPRFAEAVEAEEEWTDGEIELVWKALMKVLGSWIFPFELSTKVNWPSGDYAKTPLDLSLTILRALRLRWRVDFVTNLKHEPYLITRGCCVIVDPNVHTSDVPWNEDAEVPWSEAYLARREIARREIPAPIMEPAEHRDLIWCLRRLIEIDEWIEWIDQGAPGGERPGLPRTEAPPLRVVGGGGEATPKPAVVLGESCKQRPTVRGKAWKKRLSPELFNALKALLEVFPDPLLIEELNSKAGGGGAYKAVKHMRESDLEYWGDAISVPEGERNAGVAIRPE